MPLKIHQESAHAPDNTLFFAKHGRPLPLQPLDSRPMVLD